jgi:hypothetical protein
MTSACLPGVIKPRMSFQALIYVIALYRQMTAGAAGLAINLSSLLVIAADRPAGSV